VGPEMKMSRTGRDVSVGEENGPDALVSLVFEHLVTARRFFKREAMRGEEGKVELAFLRVLDHAAHVLLAVLLRGADGRGQVDLA